MPRESVVDRSGSADRRVMVKGTGIDSEDQRRLALNGNATLKTTVQLLDRYKKQLSASKHYSPQQPAIDGLQQLIQLDAEKKEHRKKIADMEATIKHQEAILKEKEAKVKNQEATIKFQKDLIKYQEETMRKQDLKKKYQEAKLIELENLSTSVRHSNTANQSVKHKQSNSLFGATRPNRMSCIFQSEITNSKANTNKLPRKSFPPKPYVTFLGDDRNPEEDNSVLVKKTFNFKRPTWRVKNFTGRYSLGPIGSKTDDSFKDSFVRK